MGEYRRSPHTVHRLVYHFVFITKYRKPVLRGDIAREVRELIREICRSHDIEVVRGHVLPGSCVASVGRASEVVSEPGDAGNQGEDVASSAAGPSERLRREFWGRHLWAREARGEGARRRCRGEGEEKVVRRR